MKKQSELEKAAKKYSESACEYAGHIGFTAGAKWLERRLMRMTKGVCKEWENDMRAWLDAAIKGEK